MKMVRTKESVEKELKRLLRSMDFVSENLLKNQRKRTTQQIYFDIYQGLGLAWEFLGLQCGHRHGYKRNKDGQELCRVCGKVKGVRDQYYLIPVDGAKKIGMRVVPNSKKVFENKKRAQLVRDEILFHGRRWMWTSTTLTNQDFWGTSAKSLLPRTERSLLRKTELRAASTAM